MLSISTTWQIPILGHYSFHHLRRNRFAILLKHKKRTIARAVVEPHQDPAGEPFASGSVISCSAATQQKFSPGQIQLDF
jgi:hypothetical protein